MVLILREGGKTGESPGEERENRGKPGRRKKGKRIVWKKLQLLGDFVPRLPIGALPLDPTGGLRPPDPSLHFTAL